MKQLGGLAARRKSVLGLRPTAPQPKGPHHIGTAVGASKRNVRALQQGKDEGIVQERWCAHPERDRVPLKPSGDRYWARDVRLIWAA